MTTHENSVIRFLFEDLDIRGALVNLSGVWRKCCADAIMRRRCRCCSVR